MNRKAKGFLGASLGLMLAATAQAGAPAGQAGADTLAWLAESQRLQEDPGLEALNRDWMRRYRLALETHLPVAAARGTPRELLAAALMLPAREDAGVEAGTWMAPEARGWLEAADRADPRDVLVDWALANVCMSQDAPCDRERLLRSLLQQDPDNAEIRLRALADAAHKGDAQAAERHWRAATEATVHRSRFLELGRLLRDIQREVPLPPLDARLAHAHGVWMGLGRPAEVEDMADAFVIAMLAAVAMPAMAEVTRRCEARAIREDAVRRAECIRVFTLLAADESTLLGPMVALPRLVELTEGEPGNAGWRARLRRIRWIHESALARMLPSGPDQAPLPKGYADWFIDEGEPAAMRWLLQAQGIPPEPPQDWQPRDQAMRNPDDAQAGPGA